MEVMSEMNVNTGGYNVNQAVKPNDDSSDDSSDLEFHDAVERGEVPGKRIERGYNADDMVERCKVCILKCISLIFHERAVYSNALVARGAAIAHGASTRACCLGIH